MLLRARYGSSSSYRCWQVVGRVWLLSHLSLWRHAPLFSALRRQSFAMSTGDDDGVFSSSRDEADNPTHLSYFHRRRHSKRLLSGPLPVVKCGWPPYKDLPVLDPTLHDPGNIFLKWEKEPINVLVVKKLGDDDALLIDTFAQLCQLLVERFAKVVFVEEEALRRGGDDELTNLHAHPAYCRVRSRLRVFEPHCVDACIRSARCSLPTPTQRRMSAGDGGALNGVDANNPVDFVISVGGDGTLLHVSDLFQECMPPVMAFSAGSLGFLTPFPLPGCSDGLPQQDERDSSAERLTPSPATSVASLPDLLDEVLSGNTHLVLRSRIKCVICDKDSACARVPHTRGIDESLHPGSAFQYIVLNEVVITRRGPFLSSLDIFVNGKFVTRLQGDGLIISTATGSTAYSLAAGASMLHPSVPAILLTPICAHSLSFRPVVMPAGCDISVALSDDARDGAIVSLDGRIQRELHEGDTVRVTTSAFPLPSICRRDPVADWFDSLKVGLSWNQRPHQKPLWRTMPAASPPPPRSKSSENGSEAEADVEVRQVFAQNHHVS